MSSIRMFFLAAFLLLAPFQVNAQSRSNSHKLSQTITSILNTIDEYKITPKNAPEKNISRFSNPLLHIDSGGRIQIYIYMYSHGEKEITELLNYDVNIEIINKKFHVLQGWAPFNRINEIAALPFVRLVTSPSYSITQTGSVITQGDAILKSEQLRQLGLDGSNVKIGVISDGANDRVDSQATGDLPADITVYGTCTPRPFNGPQCDRGIDCNEGTAMLEIIHDIAPGAQLAMGAASTSLEFIQRVEDLANGFGADVIVDDLVFLGEPYFEDGLIAQEVASVANQVVYISSAGNSALGHYEAGYISDLTEGVDLHNFGQAAGGETDTSLNVTIDPGKFVLSILQWNDQFGASANDYDLWLDNDAETDFLCPSCASERAQYGVQDPLELVCYYNDTSNKVTGKLKINKYGGMDKRLEVFMLGGSGISVEEYNTPDGSVFGHQGLPDVLTIGAIDANDSGVDTIEPYSSRGPARIDFPALQIREKPDLTAVDGVTVTGTGGFPSVFFGTSAAAPHVAGIAALLMQLSPSATPAMVRSALKSSAIDLGSLGTDNIFGAGRVDALAAIKDIAPDSDNDGIPDSLDKFPLNSNESVDTDNDGMGDNFEISYGLNPLDPSDAGLDPDADGLSNLEEFQMSRNPTVNEAVIIQIINSTDQQQP